MTATAPSTDVIDLAPIYGDEQIRDVGVGFPLELFVVCTESAAGGTDLTVTLQTDTKEDFSTKVDLISSAKAVVADLTAGSRILSVKVPAGVKRYLRLNYTVTGTMTAGKYTAGINLDVDNNRPYPSAFKVQ